MWNMSHLSSRTLFPYWTKRGEGATCGPVYNRGRALCAAPRYNLSPPNGLLTSGFLKHDVEHNPHIIAPDPFASDDCLDVFSLVLPFPPPAPEELNTMNPSEDEPSSGLNGRLRPRRSTIPSPLSIKPIVRKLDGKPLEEEQKRESTSSKASPSKSEDLSNKPNLSPTSQLLCPCCDRKFGAKQNVSKHIRRLHISTSKPESFIVCLFCNHAESEPSDIIRHMVDSHPNQYFACLDCHTRFPSTKELAEHKLNICEKQKIPFRSKLRRTKTRKNQKSIDSNDKVDFVGQNFSGHGFNGIVISCELKPSHIHDDADIEDNITTNFILPPSKNISTSTVLEKNGVIVLDDIQWNRRIPANFSFHNSDADQILSRLGVVHRSPKTGESTKKDWFRAIEDATQKFEKCFDTSFYSKVASNVQENLTKFLDGSFNFNPDPDSTIKTRKAKNSVVINTAEGFPILLACEQYSRNTFEGYIPRSVAPKHKWKWDNLENEKAWNPDQIKRDTHANNCIITLVSSLDIWTQLCMRRKFEDKFNITPVEKKTVKQNVIGKELKEILESREIPSSKSQIVKHLNAPLQITNEQDFPTSLGLMPSAAVFNMKPAILSGEWVRPRCYVCCACGAQSRDSRTLSLHVSSHHPNAQVQHYEIVGESLLKADILKHLYVPPCHNVNRTRIPRGFRDCTKCNKSITLEDLHQHMLDCAGDTPAVRRKCRYRPFGVRRRRPRLPDNRIRKKMRNDIRTLPTRQKNRMRPKPKIRSEVGDAETIRKMLADLPAKRHRVVVNPLNSILRPRRKLDKQRAMLMMKLRTSEDPKKSKSKDSNNTLHHAHSTNVDKYKSIPNRDDEDNRPLKSRLKRVACKIVRQKESLNRKAMLKKPRRIIRSLIEKKETDVIEKQLDTCPLKVQNDELSADHNEKRINLNSDPQNVREHSGGEETNNDRRDNQAASPHDAREDSGREDNNNDGEDNQRAGGSGQNENSRNECAPTENIPLKHSIARLTASSETHDKSVQFHQLFLIQQECNNTNKHVPTGRRVLFENEAVISRLDKPPLYYNQNISLEPVQRHNEDLIQGNSSESGHDLDSSNQTFDSIQKNKSNKPRKGLNDCIAMLKNKLVDTDPNTPGHVSVKCGTDSPINSEPIILSTSSLMTPKADVQTSPCIERPKKSAAKNYGQNEQLPRPSPMYGGHHFNYDMHGYINNERQTAQWRPVNYDAIMPRFIDNRTRKGTRRRSASQHENIFLAQQLLSMTPPHDDLYTKISPESYDAYNLLPRKSPKNYHEQLVHVVDNNTLSNFGNHKVFDKNRAESSNGALQNYGRTVKNHIEWNKKCLEASKKNTRTRISAPRKPVENLEKKISVRNDASKTARDSNERYRIKALNSLSQTDFTAKNLEGMKNNNHSQVITEKNTSNLNTEIHLTQFKHIERQLNTDMLLSPLKHSERRSSRDMNVKMSQKIYPDHHFGDIQVSIPPAHASTKVQSILPVPLDLSGKIVSLDSGCSSRHDSMSLSSYDRCETLDLSNKRRIVVEHHSQDVIVDLRVKHASQCPPLGSLEPPCFASSQHDFHSVNTIDLIQQNVSIPTDLSLKRTDKNSNKCITSTQKINQEETQIQDLSNNQTKTISTVDHLLRDNDLPTDLSHKNIVNIENTTLTLKESDTNENVTNSDDPNILNRSHSLSGKVNEENQDNPATEKLTADIHVVSESDKMIYANTNHEDETHDTVQTNISLPDIQKPIYDPTLNMHQFKTTPTETETTCQGTTITEAPPFSASIESYSSHQVLCRLQNSSVTNNSLIASIEAQERPTYPFANSALNTAVTAVAGSMKPQSVYSLLSRGIMTPFTTYESTRSVYTLPSACISMSKIDFTTNSILSIPSTIVRTTPVYTLAGTTIVTPLHYATLPYAGHSIPYPPTSDAITHYNSAREEIRTYDNNILIRGGSFNSEVDIEIIRKLMMLPKENGVILITMPSDHLHDLSDEVPESVSAANPVLIVSTQTSNYSVSNMKTMPSRLCKELPVDDTGNVVIKPLYSLQLVEDGYSSADLAHDEVLPKADIDSEGSEEQQILSPEEIPQSNAATSNVQKTNNDKTTSLRAVRIKAPSERQKLKIITNPLQSLSNPDMQIILSNDNYDNESSQSLKHDKSSGIQLYEVSSTQLNKNKVSDYKFSETDISGNKTTHQSVFDNFMKSRGDIALEEHTEESEPRLTKQSHVPDHFSDIGNQTNDSPKVTDVNLNNNNNNNIDNIISPRLQEIYKNNVTIPIPNIQEKYLEKCNLKQLEDDYDSDDDVSLAVIVKQKQEKQNNLNLVLHSNQEVYVCESTTKEKIVETSRLYNQQIKQSSQKTSTVDGTRKNIIDKMEPLLKDTYQADQNIIGIAKTKFRGCVKVSKQLKKNGKKTLRGTLVVKDVKLQDNQESQKQYNEIEINKDNDNLLHNISELMGEENIIKLNGKAQDITSIETNTDSTSTEVQGQESGEVSKNILTANLSMINVQEKQNGDENGVNLYIHDSDHIEKNKNGRIGNQNVELLLEACYQEEMRQSTVRQQSTGFEQSPITQDCADNKEDPVSSESVENNVPILNTLNIESTTEANDVVLDTFNAEENELRIRRSRYGKSLFVENKVPLIYSDSILEQKAPLTKKQLIFSKLLLDEENNLKKMAPVNNNQTLYEENNSFQSAEENNSCQSAKLQNMTFEDKNKSVKRKKSPVPKKKSKKNKSIDISQHISGDDFVKTFAVENGDAENHLASHDSGLNAEGGYTVQNPILIQKMELDSNISQSQNKFHTNNSDEHTPNVIQMTVDQNKKIEPGSTTKRKIAESANNVESISSLKPKKSKLNHINDIMVTSHSVTTALNESIRNPRSHKIPLAARRTRSKSVVVQSSGSMLYDPYDIDLEDMGEKTEPFRKQKLTLVRTDNFKSLIENKLEICATNENDIMMPAENNFNAPTTECSYTADTTFKESNSDSDESSKSDVPLKKYVEEKERKKAMTRETDNTKVMYHNVNDEVVIDDNDKKQSKKKHKKNKRSLTSIDNVQKEEKDAKEISEELRSEQFMESFGFFSERKPRKSNLLATKKISETFHIIANESDDIYSNTKERPTKKSSRSENKRGIGDESQIKDSKPIDFTKAPIKWDKNLKLRAATRYCHVCKKEFRRTDNLVRHQMTALHINKLSETESGISTPIPEEPNYLVIFKEHMDRLKILEYKMKSKKHSKSKFTLPSLKQILVDVKKTVREQQLARRNLSRDQALFLDCCELLKDSNRGQTGHRSITSHIVPCCQSSYALASVSPDEYNPNSGISNHFHLYIKTPPYSDLSKKPIIHTSARLSGMEDFVPVSSASKKASSTDRIVQPSTSLSGSGHSSNHSIQADKSSIIGEITDEKDDSKSDGDVDSITAQNILESEEVRNLENDLISGLKEKFQPLLSGDKILSNSVDLHDNLTNNSCPQVEFSISEKKETIDSKEKNTPESKEKKKLDIFENIDIFEDKFDKIKRKCRSQAAAAKLVQTPVEPSPSHKSRKKSEKKKGKRNSKKYNKNTVLTKGALKGYDSIKVSISTSEINMSAIIPPAIGSSKRKKKSNSKKKKDRKKSAFTRKHDLNGTKETINKNIDVYEFSDNEEPEFFELRPSTVMERFRNLNNKDTQFSAKAGTNREEVESSDTVSDGDDFVYMSDDYVCSDDETESSLMSCELGNVKGSNEVKKSFSPLKRKDVMEKNVVMGKIFKHNAVRSEKKSKTKETIKPKANLDQLFDSLLEKEPTSAVTNKAELPKKDSCIPEKKRVFSPVVLSKYDSKTIKNNDASPETIRSPSPALSSDSAVSKRVCTFSSQLSSPRKLSPSKYDIAPPFNYEPSLTNEYDTISEKKHDLCTDRVPNKIKINDYSDLSPKTDEFPFDTCVETASFSKNKENPVEHETAYDSKADYCDDNALSDDAGVARQRARRKCTVGKQNVLAETWSSESEPDGVPPRPNSAESVVLGVARKRKGKKREGQISGGRKSNKHGSVKKQDFVSRVTSSNRSTGSSGVAGTSRPSDDSSAYSPHLSLPGPSGNAPRQRPTTSFWADDNEETEHVQQHGWIVGDSHKKLVTMLAHAKGRKRNNDDKQHFME